MRMLLSDFYRNILHLTDESLLESLLQQSEIRTYRPGDHLIIQGEVPTSILFLIRGTVRGFLLDVNGRDITDCIVFCCGDAAMPDNDFTQPASVTMEALSDCEVVSIPVPAVLRLLEEYPALAGLYHQFVLKASSMHRLLKIAIYQYSATERYQWFLKEYPGLIDKVGHKYIASLLNMTPVTFSKVRKSLKSNSI